MEMVIFRPDLKVIDSDFEIKSKYYYLHTSCFYLNLKSTRCCFLEFVCCPMFSKLSLFLSHILNRHDTVMIFLCIFLINS